MKNKLYDSYIRAIKWASLRIADRGIVALVTNGGWLDSNTTEGMRLTIADEFSDIYILNLRGNQRTAGEQSRKEGGKIFGGGSRATVAVTILVKDPGRREHVRINYTDVGDYLTREEKLARVAKAERFARLEPVIITPNANGDWLDQRCDDFGRFLGWDEIFGLITHGTNTGRDAWVLGSSRASVLATMEIANRTLADETRRWQSSPPKGNDEKTLNEWVDKDPRKISWTSNLLRRVSRGHPEAIRTEALRVSAYRPFHKQFIYFDNTWMSRPGRSNELLPVGADNFILYVVGMSSSVPFTPLMVDLIPNLHLTGAGSGGTVVSRWRFEQVEADEGMLTFHTAEDDEVLDGGYRRVDNITDHALRTYHAAYGPAFSKDDIFFYCYGLLHSSEYATIYAADLRKMLPRIPLVVDPWPYVEAGRRLSALHLAYESAEPYPLSGLDDPGPVDDAAYEHFRVEKMTFAKVRDPETTKLVSDRSRVVYNSRITLTGIPEDAYRYMLGSRSAVEWIIDRYQVKIDKASGIVNDPNDWSREVGDPRYIIDLFARVVTVSLETMAIVDALPPLEIRSEPVS